MKKVTAPILLSASLLAASSVLAGCELIVGVHEAQLGCDRSGIWTIGSCPVGGTSSGTAGSGGTSTTGTGGTPNCKIDGAQNGSETDVDCGGATCDAQGHTCAFGKKCLADADCATGYCDAATCDAKTVGPGPALAIVSDTTSVYWAGGFGIMKAAVSGGAATSLASASAPNGIAVDATHVYWTDGGYHQVSAVAIAGGTTQILATLTSPETPTGLVVDVSSVYFGSSFGVNGGYLRRMALTGGTQTMPAIDMNPIAQVVHDAANVYWADGHGVYALPKAGGVSTTLVTGQTYSVAVDASNVYALTSDGNVLAAPTTAGGQKMILAFGQNKPSAIAVDGVNVYWTNAGDGTVMRMPVAGGTPTMIASGQGASLACLALDGTRVYWGSSASGSAIKSILK